MTRFYAFGITPGCCVPEYNAVRGWRIYCTALLAGARGIVGENIQAIEIIFLLLLTFVIVFAALARRLETPYPIVLVIAGLILSFIPAVPRIVLNPELILVVVLPPLLYAAAWTISWRDFRYNLLSISSMAIGLVAFTVAGVALASTRLFPGFDWRTGWVLGAVVAPTDAVAATAIATRLGLPRRATDLLEGESLVNDATGLLALQFGIAMVFRGETPTVWEGLSRMLYLIVAGIAAGLVVGKIADWLEGFIDDAPIEIAFSILLPYASFLTAEAIHASGALAVVSTGLYLSRRSSQFFSPDVRLQAFAVWESLTFILNGIVFVLVGLQLPYVRAGIEGMGMRQLIIHGAIFSGLVIALRLVWVFPGARLSYFLRRHLLKHNENRPTDRQLFVVAWTGMRGVVSLAAAMSLPVMLAGGRPFPNRNLIVFLTFSVILVTLVLQGLTLPKVIRALGLAGSEGGECEESEARRIVTEAALEELDQLRDEDDDRFRPVYEDLEQHYRQRLSALGRHETDGHDGGDLYVRYLQQQRRLMGVERRTAIGLRNAGRIRDEVLRRIERELDLAESRLAQMREEEGPPGDSPLGC